MAQKKQGRRTQTNTRKGGTATRTQVAKPQQQTGGFRFEIVLIVAFALAVFLEISNFGLCGTVGDAISGFLFGVFGCVQYILPILIFVGMAFLFANGFSGQAVKKVVYFGVLTLDVSMLAQLITGLSEEVTAGVLYREAFVGKSGGGFIGGGLALLLKGGIGIAGAYLVVIVIAIIMIILFTEKSLIRLLQNGGIRLMDGFRDAKERGQEYQEKREVERMSLEEIRAAKQAEREAARQERKEKAKNELDIKREAMEREKAKAELEKEAAASQQEPEYNRFQHKVKKGLFRNLTVLPSDGEQGMVKNEEFRQENPLNQEEVHEITMTFEEEEESDMESMSTVSRTVSPTAVPSHTKTAPIAVTEAAMGIEEEEEELAEVPEEKPVRKRRVQRTKQSAQEMEEATQEVSRQMEQAVVTPVTPAAETESGRNPAYSKAKQPAAARRVETGAYQFPPYDLLKKGKGNKKNNEAYIQETMQKLQGTLDSFGVRATITDYSCGPAVTRFELQPEQGVKVSKIVGLADDIKLNLAAADIRIEAPIPGKAAVGIEIPNKENAAVMFRDLIEDDSFIKFPSDIAFAVGKDISGQVMVADIAKMPHLLIAGATGSGKSVCINTIIMSILYKAHPEDVKLIMIDPKVVELTAYNGIPHLLIPVVTDPKKAAGALNWAVVEMTKRYQLFAEYNVRNLKGYNKKVEEVQAQVGKEEGESEVKKLPQIVVIVDELADLMMVAHGEVEDAIVRLSQLARAAGIHLVIATQRPSVDVITGLIKANVPSRIAFAVSSLVDSRTILDMSGAEKLLGKGDMLFYPTGLPKPVRVQGAFVSDEEVSAVVDFLKNQSQETAYDAEITSQIESSAVSAASASGGSGEPERDEYFQDAARVIIESDKASIGMLQRKFKIGFNRAARIMDQLAEAGIVGPDEGTKPRTILMSPEQFEEYVEEYL
ncbi:MAG: DNA translocase FtsK 4TM domain-containing protein [Bacteroides sp.]|nr:DNA translocase FtsK 4TM domain-containing protein [Bacteroides sp.]MCM1549275.1 DNA translocase FtsK 4TM domain-containing protein [Clostridium sp.]